jgi:cytochrome P450
VLLGRQNGRDIASFGSARDEKQHGAMRRSIANAFTPTATLDYERWIDETIEELLEVVGRKTKTKTTTITTGKFDLSSMIVWYTMDSAGRFSFGAPFGCLAAEADVSGSVQVIRDRFAHWARWASLPRLERFVHRNPLLEAKHRSPSAIVAMASEKLEARMRSGSTAPATSTKGQNYNDEDADAQAHPYTPSPDVLQRFLEARKDFPQTLDRSGIIGSLVSIISGSSDTTASTITATLFYLLKSPDAMRELETELMRADLPEIPAYNDVGKLPYLNAVIKESMRLFNPISMPLERLVPAGGITIAGTYFPEGTSVGCSEYYLCSSKFPSSSY